jgi:hypothetical protein
MPQSLAHVARLAPRNPDEMSKCSHEEGGELYVPADAGKQD